MSLNEEKEKAAAQPQAEETPKADDVKGSAETPENDLEKKLAELDDRYKRVLAEYQNFRTRSQKEKDSLYLDSVASTVAGFLPVIDTLERAMGQETDEGFKKSLELIIKQYDECLERFGVKPFAERGDAFDPNIHNAVMHVEDDSLEGNVVAEVLLKGYMLGERVVRHAMVKVAN